LDEERRLFYVGVTRAEKHLILTYSRRRQVNGRWVNRLPSRFIEEIKPQLYVKHTNGFRPISQDERKKMLSDLMNKLST
jgi:DNA helicase-2/ATP-dependent DNA helicase PcrA